MDSFGTGAQSVISLSDDGEYAIQLDGKDLIIYSHPAIPELRDDSVVRTKDSASSIRFLKFSKPSGASDRRLLCASDTRVSVWQLRPLRLYAEIENIEPGALNIDFGSNEDEILVFHSWNTKVTIFTLDTKQSRVIKSPKFTHPGGFGYRPRTGQLAILLKPETNDLLTIHEPPGYEVIGRAVLSTVDAQGLKWSPDGKWIAVWEAASAGTKVLIFTADGQHFRTYTGPPGVDDSYDIGVRNIEWSPVTDNRRDSEFLAVGKYDGSVDILQSKTFSCSTSFSHIFHMDQGSAAVWRERQSTVNGNLEYAGFSSSAASAMITEPSGSPRGVSAMAFSSDGSFLGTVDQLRPNVVWIWSLRETPKLAATLVHEHPVRQLIWHPWKTELLISTTNGVWPAVRIWSPISDPQIVHMPIPRRESGRYDVRWCASKQHGHSVFWFGATEDYVVGYLAVQNGSLGFNVLRSLSRREHGDISGTGNAK